MHARGELARPPHIEAARQALLDARAQRVRPGLDDKVLTEWNGLMIATLAEAAAATGDAAWLADAERAAGFLVDELRRDDGRWLRSWQQDGGARHLAFAADHAALVDAFTRLAEASGRARWIDEARTTADALLELFADEAGGFVTTGRDGEALVARSKDVMDNATPAANTLAASGLLRLAALTGEDRYRPGGRRRARAARRGVRAAPVRLRQPPGGGRDGRRGPHRGRGGRRRPRPGRGRAAGVPPERRAGVGRAVPVAAVGGPPARATPTCAVTTPAGRPVTDPAGLEEQLASNPAG